LQAHGGLLDSIVCSASFWARRRASQGAFENSKFAIPDRGKREKSLFKAAAKPHSHSSVHAFVTARSRNARSALPPGTVNCLIWFSPDENSWLSFR
jgi:hypothetical protein